MGSSPDLNLKKIHLRVSTESTQNYSFLLDSAYKLFVIIRKCHNFIF